MPHFYSFKLAGHHFSARATMTQNAPFLESSRPPHNLRAVGVCLLLVAVGARSCDSSTDQERDAYCRVKVNLLSHPYAVNKIPPKVNRTEGIDIEIGFTPQEASIVILVSP
ncbi:hypothetical protein ElyMa_005995500 [Elysia marginata]|uniref:Uncharacterized protein n=1 Tax=Elysia marginata TaxID=1093978 RepID=A0AAV4GG90_9GAST|nr:hypothetical protein ElyMa_005995500 [Elysia marginata]